MEYIVDVKPKRVNQWMNEYISPGPVAPVGDVLVNETLKKSCPELAPRFSFKPSELSRRGAGVQDGTWYNDHNYGLAAKVNRQSFYDKSFDRREVGVSVQDLQLHDLKADTRMLAAPQFGWKNTKATLLNARVTGEQFLPRPVGYNPSGISRGNQPRVNVLVDNTPVLPTLKPLEKLDPVVSNAPSPNGRDPVYAGQENIQPPLPSINNRPGMTPGMSCINRAR